jgi:hypothetical protein
MGVWLYKKGDEDEIYGDEVEFHVQVDLYMPPEQHLEPPYESGLHRR